MSESVILEEEIDEDYEPTSEEILEYATWLGMDPQVDREFFYIAKEGLKAPLPDPWKPCKTKEGEIYYFNFENGESVWEHPCDEYYRNMFDEAKTAKANRGMVTKKQTTKKKKTSNKTGAGKKKMDNDPVEIMDNFQIPKAQKKSLGTYDSSSGQLRKQEEDPILKMDREKKQKQAKEAAEKQQHEALAILEQEFSSRKQKLKRQSADELEELDRRFNEDKANIEYEIKNELKAEADRKQNSLRKDSQQREDKETRLEVETFDKKIAEIQRDYEAKLQTERTRIQTDIELERKSLLGKEEKLIMTEIDNLKREVEYQREKVTREEQELQEMETRYREKTSRLEQDFKADVETERSRISLQTKGGFDPELLPKEAEIHTIESQLNLDRGDIDLRIKEKQLEVQQQHDDKLSQMRKELESQDSENIKLKTKDIEFQLQNELEAGWSVLDSKFSRQRDDLDKDLSRELEGIKRQNDKVKEEEVSKLSKDIQIKLEGDKHRMEIESRKRIEEKRGRSPANQHQERLMEIQKELNTIQDQIKATEQKIEYEHQKTSRAADELQSLEGRLGTLESEPSQKYLIDDLKKQIELKDREFDYTGSPRADMAKLGKLEADITDIKHSISQKINLSPSKQTLDKDSVGRWKKIIQSEKSNIKQQQRLLEKDRALWKEDANDIVSRPYSNPGKKAELTSVKKVLDAQTRQLNGRIREMRFVEKWVTSKENADEVPDFDFEEDVLNVKQEIPDVIDEDILFAWKSGRDVDSSFDVSGINTPNAPGGYQPFFKKQRQPRVQSARRRAEWELTPGFTRPLMMTRY